MFCGSLACASPAKKRKVLRTPCLPAPCALPRNSPLKSLGLCGLFPQQSQCPVAVGAACTFHSRSGAAARFSRDGGREGGQQFVRNRVSGKVAAIPIPRARISMSNRLFCGGCVPVSATPSPGKVHFSTHTPQGLKWATKRTLSRKRPPGLLGMRSGFGHPRPRGGGRLRPIPFYLTATPLPPTPCVRVIDRRNGRCAPKLAPGLSDGYGASDGAAGQPCVLQCFCTF